MACEAESRLAPADSDRQVLREDSRTCTLASNLVGGAALRARVLFHSSFRALRLLATSRRGLRIAKSVALLVHLRIPAPCSRVIAVGCLPFAAKRHRLRPVG